MPATLWAPRLSAMTMSPGAGSAPGSLRRGSARHRSRVEDGAVSPVTHRGEQRAGLPAPAGGVTRAPRGARPYRRRIGGAAGFVQTHARSAPPRATRPARPRRQADRVRTGGPLFLTVRPRARTARQTVGTLAGVARASFRSARVRSGCAAISAAKVWRCGSSMPRRPCRWTRGATSPVSRRRCFSSPHPRPAHAVLRPPHRPPSSRHRCRGAPALADPSNRHASVLLHRCAQKYHDRHR